MRSPTRAMTSGGTDGFRWQAATARIAAARKARRRTGRAKCSVSRNAALAASRCVPTMLSSQAEIDENAPAELLQLDADHPGFHDAVYRRRRKEIARAALDYREGQPVPSIGYTEQEHDVWAEVWRHLDPLHERYACRAYRDAGDRIALSRERIPQLIDVNATIRPLLGFRMTPVAGLVAAKSFLSQLGRDVFLSTQYMRHHSVPLYTPEPDVVHELIGHAATFGHEGFVRLNRAFGEATLRAGNDETIEQIGRLYWFTLEFGVMREGAA